MLPHHWTHRVGKAKVQTANTLILWFTISREFSWSSRLVSYKKTWPNSVWTIYNYFKQNTVVITYKVILAKFYNHKEKLTNKKSNPEFDSMCGNGRMTQKESEGLLLPTDFYCFFCFFSSWPMESVGTLITTMPYTVAFRLGCLKTCRTLGSSPDWH